MTPVAYYNEFDPYAAQWLRNLIDAGHIAWGIVDERSIEDVVPNDLEGFTQCHFFAGIGIWSFALRRAGWPDDRPVWTGSCPCQPFSAAGKGNGFADERHFWPAFNHLIAQRRPPTVFGEQVASKNADAWLDLVCADVEAVGYAFGAIPFPSASVGAPHIRDRLYWVAHSDRQRCVGEYPLLQREKPGRVAQDRAEVAGCGAPEWLANNNNPGLEGWGQPGCERPAELVTGAGGVAGGLDNSNSESTVYEVRAGRNLYGSTGPTCEASPTNGFWRDADWLLCRDGKWRPVSPLPQPLVDGSSESLGRVRPEVIAQFEEEVNAATAQSEGGRAAAMRDLLDHLGAEAKRSWAFGGIPGLHEAPFLLAFLRQLQTQGWRVAECVFVPCPEAFAPGLRGLRGDGEPTGAPRQYGLAGQLPRERADVVLVLSSLLARHAREAWDRAHAAHAETGFPLANGLTARVGRLRAYGNGLCAPAAETFIRAYLET